jgi:UDP-glucose:(heptosyl)LPS alpha-1,3-glucosyltransferase
MKLAIVRQKYTPFGGAERFVARALDALRAQGIEVEIVAREWETNGQGDAAGVKCDPFYLGRTWRDAGFARCVRRVIASGRYDLVQSHERIPGCHIFRAGDGVHATWLELRAHARGGFARLAASLSPWHRYTLAAEAAMFRHPDLRAVICNSHMVKDDIARRFGVADDKLHVIHNGVDLARFHPGLRDEFRQATREKVGAGGTAPAGSTANNDTAPVILFVGSGFERKGVGVLLAALARMERRDAVAWIVGRDRHAARYQALAERLGIAARVRFLGGQEDVRPFYGSADVFCLPTLYDPMPNAALEALACGLPVVTSPTSGAAELVKPGENGNVCDALDASTLAGHLDTLCAAGVAAEMRAAARTAVAALGAEDMAARLAALYGRLI